MFRIALRALIEESREVENVQIERVARRNLRDHSNLLDLPNTLFVQHYRVNKSVFTYLLDELKLALPKGRKVFAIPVHIKLAACLWFLAEGGYQKGIARDREISLAQPSFSKVFAEVLDSPERCLCSKWIKWPTREERGEICQYLYTKYRIPGVIGCVDGTQVAIIAPEKNKHLYYNRKGYYSLNVMIVCDDEQRIRCIDATHPGSFLDSRIWTTSQCRAVLQREFSDSNSNMWLLGDAGYSLEPWLMTPFRNPQLGSPQLNFNDMHAKRRNIVKRTIGVLKNRWRCLLVARQLHYCPKKAIKITNVCSDLHNICIAYKSFHEITSLDEHICHEQQAEEEPAEDVVFLDVAQRIRSNICNNL